MVDLATSTRRPVFGLAGIAVGLPVTYVLVYAPRNGHDLVVVAELLEAAILHAMQQA